MIKNEEMEINSKEGKNGGSKYIMRKLRLNQKIDINSKERENGGQIVKNQKMEVNSKEREN